MKEVILIFDQIFTFACLKNSERTRNFAAKMKKYSIVEFIEENTVEIILSSWISSNNKTALWPKDITPSILRKYLKNNTVPNDNWSSVNIKVLGHTDSFANATKKAYKAEETSHLSNSDSDLETYCTTKRQKKLPLRYQSNSDDEDVALEKQHVHSTKRTKHSVLPPFPEYEDCEITKTNQHKELPRDSLIINSPTVCNTNAKNQRKEEINAEKSNNIQHFKEGVLTKIFKVIEEVRFEIIASRREQQEIIIKLDTLFMQNNNSNVNKFSRLLPISSMERFDEIDQCLINSEKDFISLVKYLNLASGETVKELVPSVMKLLMKKTVSIHFCGCGKQKKRDFSATKVAAAVFEIVSKKLQDASRSEILQKISKFLAESGDREGGRKERAKSTN